MPSTRVQLDLAESLHHEATPYTLVLRGKRLNTITPSAELITENVASPFLPTSHMRAKESGLAVIYGRHRLSAHGSIAEEFINLTHGRCSGRSRGHISSGYDWLCEFDIARSFMTQ